MDSIESVDELWDFIAYVVAYAPIGFPHRDYLAEDQQLTLDRAFERLRSGVTVAYPEQSFAQKRKELNELLSKAQAEYQAGNELSGEQFMYQFEDEIFKKP